MVSGANDKSRLNGTRRIVDLAAKGMTQFGRDSPRLSHTLATVARPYRLRISFPLRLILSGIPRLWLRDGHCPELRSDVRTRSSLEGYNGGNISSRFETRD